MRKTIYKKIYNDLIHKIKAGLLKSGEALPSTRELAHLYQCHRFTVMNVYQDLAAESWVTSLQRSRYVVSEKIPVMGSLASFYKVSKKNLSEVALSIPDFDLERKKYRLEFWGGQPDLRLFPKDEFRRILSTALKRTQPEQLNYGLTDGVPHCLQQVSKYLRRSRNLINKDFVMTNGSQEALLLIFQAFAKGGDYIAVEKKGYPPAWKLFESLGAKLIPIDVDAEGFNTDDLKEKMKTHKIKMIYVTPLHQYPTTVTMSPRRRQSLIEIAEKNLIPILEDDYDHEFHYIGPPPAPISTETDIAIYVCSFSKVLFPGARLGVLACDPKISRYLSFQKYLISRQTDCLAQIALSAWIKDGGFEKHLRKMRRIYENRFHFMQDQLHILKKKSNLNWVTPTGGMSIWVNLNQDSKKISDLAKKQNVFFQFESEMNYTKITGTHLRIGFAGVNEKEISEGFEILKKII